MRLARLTLMVVLVPATVSAQGFHYYNHAVQVEQANQRYWADYYRMTQPSVYRHYVPTYVVDNQAVPQQPAIKQGVSPDPAEQRRTERIQRRQKRLLHHAHRRAASRAATRRLSNRLHSHAHAMN